MGQSLPVYMYFNPSWSHAHSAFAVAPFVWYWHETRATHPSLSGSFSLLIAGLMLNVYYPNAMLLSVLAVEAIPQYRSAFRRDSHASAENVPRQLSADLQRYLFRRKALMQQIEQRDIQQLEKNPSPP